MILGVCFSGCTSSPKEKIIGQWLSQEDEMSDAITFYANGSAYHEYFTVLDEEWTNYSIVGDRLTLGDVVYSFSFSDDTLTLILTNISENTTRTYQRQ